MNFDYMPELRWLLGYPFALALMTLVSVTLHLIFKLRGGFYCSGGSVVSPASSASSSAMAAVPKEVPWLSIKRRSEV